MKTTAVSLFISMVDATQWLLKNPDMDQIYNFLASFKTLDNKLECLSNILKQEPPKGSPI
jgi:hypothetical protein